MPFENTAGKDPAEQLQTLRMQIQDGDFVASRLNIEGLRDIAEQLSSEERASIIKCIENDDDRALMAAVTTLYPQHIELVNNLINEGSYPREQWNAVDADLRDTVARVLGPDWGFSRAAKQSEAA